MYHLKKNTQVVSQGHLLRREESAHGAAEPSSHVPSVCATLLAQRGRCAAPQGAQLGAGGRRSQAGAAAACLGCGGAARTPGKGIAGLPGRGRGGAGKGRRQRVTGRPRGGRCVGSWRTARSACALHFICLSAWILCACETLQSETQLDRMNRSPPRSPRGSREPLQGPLVSRKERGLARHRPLVHVRREMSRA